MGSRYTKSIPEKIYFQDMNNGWFAGPFVKPPKGVKNLIVCNVQRESKPFTDDERQKLEKWLKTEEGIQKIRQSQVDAEKFIESLGLNESIDPKILREPFTI